MHPSVSEFLSNRENLELALELERALQVFRPECFETFWARVRTSLQALLDASDAAASWEVAESGPIEVERNELRLLPLGKPEGARLVVAKRVSDEGNGAWFGVRVPVDYAAPRAAELDRKLRERLAGQRYRFEPGFPGWRHFGTCDQPRLCRRYVPDDLVLVVEDNRNDGPQAGRHAQPVWDLFLAVRDLLESYNVALPAALTGVSPGDA